MYIMDINKEIEIGTIIFVDGKLYIYDKCNFLVAVGNEEEYKKMKEVFVG